MHLFEAVHRPAHVEAQRHSREELDEGHNHLRREREVALHRRVASQCVEETVEHGVQQLTLLTKCHCV